MNIDQLKSERLALITKRDKANAEINTDILEQRKRLYGSHGIKIQN